MPLLGFNPAAPTNAQGIITYCENWIPADAGMEAAPSIADIGANALSAACTGAFLGQKLDGSYRLFAGTGTKLYEQNGTSWTDRSVGAGNYTAASQWSFCQFGDATIASNLSDAMQASTSGAFGNLTSPKAKYVESVVTGAGGFVFAFNIVDGSWGTFTDGWWCSSINDHTTWTVSTATQCTRGRLIGSGGPIVGAKAFGSDAIIAYKQTSMYHGRYVGNDAVWAFTEVPEVGAVGPRAMCDIGSAHFIVGPTGFWLYDGARPVRIGGEVRQWFANNVDYENIAKTEAVYDQASNRVFVHFRTAGASGLNRALVWHVGTQQWGLASYGIETTLEYIAPGVSFANDTGTWNADTGTFDGATASRKLRAVFDTSHKLGTVTGIPGTSKFQTHDIGDPVRASRLTEATVLYATRPLTASCSTYASSGLGGTELVGPTTTAFDSPGSSSTPGRFPLRQHARWHRCQFEFTGSCAISDATYKVEPTGTR
jgi:hypothetical protein